MYVTKFVIVFVAFLIGGCTQTQPYRVETFKKIEGTWIDQICRMDSRENNPAKCANYAVEHRSYKYELETQGKSPETIEGDYYLTFVEFDDQGWFSDRKQMEVLLRLLYEGDQGKQKQTQKETGNEDFLIFVFAHGWRHNASACDNNVVCFQRQLERLAILEKESGKLSREARPRTVVGVYVGWRGLSANVQPFELLSFWDRKNTAQRVGLGGVTELFTRLNDFRRYKNKGRRGDKTQLIVIGHSFGGKVIYSALAHSLIERAAHMEKDEKDQRLKYGSAHSFGDLVVLVNPAFEGAIYEPLHHVATNRCYPERQRPVMLVITSKGDAATRTTFPMGRTLSNLFESTTSSEQGSTVLHTVGHLERYKTHDLRLAEGVDPKWSTDLDKSDCGCPHLKPTKKFLEDDWGDEKKFLINLWKENERLKNEAKKKKIQELKASGKIYQESEIEIDYVVSPRLAEDEITYGGDIKMIRNPDYASNYPYFVISTDAKIIAGHNEIYGEHFIKFLRRFYIRHIKTRINFPEACFKQEACLRSDIEPCERSCRRVKNEEASCSARWVPK